MSLQYTLMSADSHIDLNPDVWNHRVAAEWRERAPKRVKTETGSDAVQVDGGKPGGRHGPAYADGRHPRDGSE